MIQITSAQIFLNKIKISEKFLTSLVILNELLSSVLVIYFKHIYQLKYTFGLLYKVKAPYTFINLIDMLESIRLI